MSEETRCSARQLVNKGLMVIEPDWLNMSMDRREDKVMLFELTKYDFAAAYLDTSALLLTGSHM